MAENTGVVIRTHPEDRVYGGGIKRSTIRSTRHRGRRVSYKDLGVGEYEGWMKARKPKSKKWEKCNLWCVLKKLDLYIYEDQKSAQATSRIHVPMFTISDANKETRSKKGAFKIHNPGTAFYFLCQDDATKHEWMNHLLLATIGYSIDPESLFSDQTSGYSSISKSYSDVEDDDEVDSDYSVATLRKSRQSAKSQPHKLQSIIDSNPEFKNVVTSLRDADIDLVGANQTLRRQSQLRKSMAGFAATNSTAQNKQMFVLRAKERQLQDLEDELGAIDELLSDINKNKLSDFLVRYADFYGECLPNIKFNGSSNDLAQLTINELSSDSSENLNNSNNNETPRCSTRVTSTCSRRTQSSTNRNTIICDDNLFNHLPVASYTDSSQRLPVANYTDSSQHLSASPRHSSQGVFTAYKHKQQITHL